MLQNLKPFLKKLKFQYTLSILVKTPIIQAFSVEYCSLDRLVNQHTVTMTFVNSLSRATPSQSKQPRSQSNMDRTCFSYSVNIKATVLAVPVDLVFDGSSGTGRPSF